MRQNTTTEQQAIEFPACPEIGTGEIHQLVQFTRKTICFNSEQLNQIKGAIKIQILETLKPLFTTLQIERVLSSIPYSCAPDLSKETPFADAQQIAKTIYQFACDLIPCNKHIDKLAAVAIHANNRDARNELCRQVNDMLLEIYMCRYGKQLPVDDIFQDAWIIVFKKSDYRATDGRFIPYFKGFLGNLLKQSMSRKYKKQMIELPDDNPDTTSVQPDDKVLNDEQIKLQYRTLWECFQILNSRQKNVLLERIKFINPENAQPVTLNDYRNELQRHEDVASNLSHDLGINLSESVVRNIFYQAVVALRKCMSSKISIDFPSA